MLTTAKILLRTAPKELVRRFPSAMALLRTAPKELVRRFPSAMAARGFSAVPNMTDDGPKSEVPKNGKKVVDAVYVAETKLPTDIGDFMLRAYRVPGQPVGQEPCVIYARDKPPMGGAAPAGAVPARIHDQCLTSEVFGSRRCDCKEQLLMTLQYIQKHGGFIVYLQQEGRGIGLANKIAAYALQDLGFDTVDANRHLGFADDMREYDVLPSILSDMNVASIQLMTNNPRKVERLTALHVNVVRTLPMVVPSVNIHNRKYMETKQTRMNHANLAELLQRSALNNNGKPNCNSAGAVCEAKTSPEGTRNVRYCRCTQCFACR